MHRAGVSLHASCYEIKMQQSSESEIHDFMPAGLYKHFRNLLFPSNLVFLYVNVVMMNAYMCTYIANGSQRAVLNAQMR